MHKIFLTAFFLSAIITFNINNAKAAEPLDSIGVENDGGLQVIIYRAEAKETYYSIARQYNVSPKTLLTYNDNKYLKIGTIIKIPTSKAFGKGNTSNNPLANSDSSYFIYTVIAKDNLNLLSEKFGTTIQILKEINNLSGSNLSIGQTLKIPQNAQTAASTQALNNQPVVVKTTEDIKELPTSNSVIEHVVKPKEFLNKIAERYNTTVEEIKKLNSLTSTHLQIGQILKIPVSNSTEEKPVEVANKPTNIPVVPEERDATGMHKVISGENIFSIAKRFGITAYQIRQANDLNDNNLKIGQLLKIPSNISVDVSVPISQQSKQGTEDVKADTTEKNSFEYTVVNGDDIYSIAKKFNLTTYQIKTASKIKSNDLKIGQKLLIPKPPEPQSVNEASLEDQTEHPDSLTLKDPKLRRDPSVYGLSQVEEKGTGIWIADQDLDGSKMLVLHRTAPIGTVVKITNPMTNISTFAKVVGKFTENESTKDVIIVMTKAVADSLGALDKRFLCNIMYAQ